MNEELEVIIFFTPKYLGVRMINILRLGQILTESISRGLSLKSSLKLS